jgi:hypothetical protein
MSGQRVEGIVSVSRQIPANAKVIFDLLADPGRHPEIDGSDSVKRARPNAPDRLSLGTRFGMDMKFLGVVPYRITNEVIEFEENSLVAWRHLGHHTWRYELESLSPESTNVTESFEWGVARVPKFYELVGYPRSHIANMTRTLERLARVVS